jgi:hypothetical protein
MVESGFVKATKATSVARIRKKVPLFPATNYCWLAIETVLYQHDILTVLQGLSRDKSHIPIFQYLLREKQESTNM